MCDTARDECMLLTGSEEEAYRQSEAHTSGQVGCDQEGWSLSAHQGLDDALYQSFVCPPSTTALWLVQNYALHII